MGRKGKARSFFSSKDIPGGRLLVVALVSGDNRKLLSQYVSIKCQLAYTPPGGPSLLNRAIEALRQ